MPIPIISARYANSIEQLLRKAANEESAAPETKKPAKSGGDIVRTTNDMVSMLLRLPKYNKVAIELRQAANNPTTGIVNFVTGDDNIESGLINGILKLSFPPGSGKVYKESYDASASEWNNPAQELNRRLDGSPSTMSEAEVMAIIQAAQDLAKGNERTINKFVASSLGLPLENVDVNKAIANRNRPRADRPAAPATPDAFGNVAQQEPENLLLNILQTYDQIKESERQKSQIGKAIQRKRKEQQTANDTEVQTKLRFQLRLLQDSFNEIENQLTGLCDRLPGRRGGSPIPDGKGFLHTTPMDLSQLFGKTSKGVTQEGLLTLLANPAKNRLISNEKAKQLSLIHI